METVLLAINKDFIKTADDGPNGVNLREFSYLPKLMSEFAKKLPEKPIKEPQMTNVEIRANFSAIGIQLPAEFDDKDLQKFIPLKPELTKKMNEEIKAYFTANGVSVPADFDANDLRKLNPLKPELTQKMIEKLMKEPQAMVEKMVAEKKSREEIKSYLDSVKVTIKCLGVKTTYIEEEGKDKGKEMTTLLDEQEYPLLSPGEFFPRIAPSADAFVKHVQGQDFAGTLYTKDGNFTAEGMIFFMLNQKILTAPAKGA